MILVKKCTQFEQHGTSQSGPIRLLPKRPTLAPPHTVKAKRKRRERSHERETTEIITLTTEKTKKRQRWTSVDGERRRLRSNSFSPTRSTEERRFRPRPPNEGSNPSLTRSNLTQVKQRLSDKEHERLASDLVRRQQRREIYALNSLMAEHERSCFEQYLKTNGNCKMTISHSV